MPVLVKNRKKPYTLQEVFNKAWNHAVVKQKPRCTNVTTCRYRAKNNKNACLIGINIPDVLYNPKMEGNTVSMLSRGRLLPDLFRNIDISTLNDLQVLHDYYGKLINENEDSTYRKYIKKSLKDFAGQHELKIPKTNKKVQKKK